MQKNIVVIEGDGIGPEVTRQAIKVLNAVADAGGHDFTYHYHLMGACAIEKTGNPLPDETIEAALNSDAILFGAIGHPKYDNDPTAKVRPEQGLLKLRKSLKLFANIRPVATYPALQHLSPLKSKILEGVDFVIFRELTGGIYFGKKEVSEDGTKASDECVYSRDEIERIAHLAFQQAQKRRKKLTLVDKANVLETSRLWRKVVQEVAGGYTDVKVDFLFVDNAAMQIICCHPHPSVRAPRFSNPFTVPIRRLPEKTSPIRLAASSLQRCSSITSDCIPMRPAYARPPTGHCRMAS